MRTIISVVGDGEVRKESDKYNLAYDVGKALVDAGYRVQTGGRGGIMQAALEGAKASKHYKEGDTIAILPSFEASDANPYADVVVPTGLGVYRNAITANAEAVIAIGGGSGTLSEMAIAWTLGRMVVAFDCVEGWSRYLAGKPLDDKVRYEDFDDIVWAASSVEALMRLLHEKLKLYSG